MLNKKIKFIAVNKRYSKIQPAPKPAYMYKPTWYSMSPVYMSDGTPDKKLKMTDEGKNMTFKKCLPFIDTNQGLEVGIDEPSIPTQCSLFILFQFEPSLPYFLRSAVASGRVETVEMGAGQNRFDLVQDRFEAIA